MYSFWGRVREDKDKIRKDINLSSMILIKMIMSRYGTLGRPLPKFPLSAQWITVRGHKMIGELVAHPGTPMLNICCFSDAIISVLIKSSASIFLSIFPILFLSQFHIWPPLPSSIFAPVVHGPLAPAYFWAGLSVKARERPVGEQRGVYDESFDAHTASLSCNFSFYFSHCLRPKIMYL